MTQAATQSGPAGLAVHSFELYGLTEPPRFLALYGLDPHAGCDLLTFCRNPLHPGPCKGWKDRLKVVAPGVHKMIEDDRKAKLAARRASRKGLGKGRDGDGDGKKGEDDGKKPPKKPRAKAKDEPPKDEPYADPGHEVKLRKETRALVAAAVKVLPKDDDGWKAVVQGEEETFRPIDEMVTNALTKYAQAVVERNQSRDNFARNLRQMSWEELVAQHPTEADTLTNSPTGRRLEENIKRASDAHDQIKTYRDALMDKIRAAGGDPDKGVFPAPYEHLADSYGYRTRRRPLVYPKDSKGADMVPPELAKMHEAVQKAGAAIGQDIRAHTASDPKIQAIDADLGKFNDKALNADRISERHEARLEVKRLKYERKKRERELIVDALGQFRPMGGGKVENVTPVQSRSDLDSMGRSSSKVARRDWRAQLEETAAHLPTDWVERSNKTKMEVISHDRAFHASPNDWRDGTDQRATTLAMNSDKGAANVSYDGAFPTYVHEVTFHEFGHRLESQIPGIKALEFAYVRSKATLPSGDLEPQVRLKDVYGGAYKDTEVAYRDRFPDLYTGKTYEGRAGDPANESWEAFQVGLQDTFGRGSRKFGEPDLEELVLGVMATVGRA